MAVTGHPRHLQVRHGTAAEWLAADPVLYEGEVGYETDTNKAKVGDGVDVWSARPYLTAGGSVAAGGSSVMLGAGGHGDLEDDPFFVPGVAGPSGAQGVDGDPGQQGPPGAPGTDGEEGEWFPVPGVQGTAGSAGAQGDPGATGAQGAVGPTGEQGEEGEWFPVPGAQGAAGSAGAQGDAGAAGSQGLAGPPGLQGDDGEDGLMGPPGTAGAAGAQGDAGAAGAAGPQGGQGVPGFDGDDPENLIVPGQQGAAGATGAQGTQGVQGLQGPIGIIMDGEDGDFGPPGTPGVAGAAGAAGAPGAQGLQGPIGIILDGDDGSDGPPGPPGAAGVAGADGGVGGTIFFADKPPDTPGSSDDEFDDAAVAGWTEYDHGTTVVPSEGDFGLELAPTAGGDAIGGLLKSVPADPCSVAVKVQPSFEDPLDMTAGLVLTDGTGSTNDALLFKLYWLTNSTNLSTYGISVTHYSDYQTWSAEVYTFTVAGSPDQKPGVGLLTSWYLRIRHVSAVWYWEVSQDGVSWRKLMEVVDGSMPFTPTHIGPAVQGAGASARFRFFRELADTGFAAPILGGWGLGAAGADGAPGADGAAGPSTPKMPYIPEPDDDAPLLILDKNILNQQGYPGGSTFLRADRTWAAPAGAPPSATTVEVNLGAAPAAVWQGKFTITDASITSSSKVFVWQAPGPYTGKGTRADEAEMAPVRVVATEPATGSAVVKWRSVESHTPLIHGPSAIRVPVTTVAGELRAIPNEIKGAGVRGKVRGNVKFSYLVF